MGCSLVLLGNLGQDESVRRMNTEHGVASEIWKSLMKLIRAW